MRVSRWLLLGLLIAPINCRAADPSALWKIVNGQCVPHQEAAHDPAPCSSVDLALGVEKGFAALKDIRGVAQFLLIPTARISGIEDPAILAPGATNYWNAAWKARHFVEERLHVTLPRDAISLAINSAYGRTQNQLHIHIDCIRPDIHDAVAQNLDQVAGGQVVGGQVVGGQVVSGWTPFPTPLAGHNYRSIRLAQATLDGVDPFRLLADADPKTIIDMGMHTLVLIGANFQDGTEGFVLLDDHVDLAAGNTASGEELQDHSCAIAPR